jgi:hypothetical protein
MTIKNTSGRGAYFGYGDASVESTASFGVNGIAPAFYLANGASKSGLPYSLAANPQFLKDIEAGLIEVTVGAPLITLKNIAAVKAYFGYLPPTYPLAAGAEGPIMSRSSGLPGVRGLADELADGGSALAKDIAASRVTTDGAVITLAAVTNGTINPAAGAHAVNIGADFDLVMTPDTGYHIGAVLDNGVSKPLTSPYHLDSVSADHTIAVTFAINTYAVIFDLDGGVRTGGGALNQTIDHGAAAVAPTYTAPSGYRIADVPWDAPLTNITAAQTITALYTKVWNVNFDLDGGARTGGGDLAQVIDEHAAAAAPTYTPPAGYRIADIPWDTDFSDITADTDVTALYTKIWTLTYTAGANGSIVGTTPQTVDDGADGSLVTATPDPLYQFAGWSDDPGPGITIPAARTDLAVGADINVTASFTLI